METLTMDDPDVPAILAKLPHACFANVPGSRGPRTLRIVRGVPGYTHIGPAPPADHFNAGLPVPPTPDQVEAMLVGSMFGWHVRGADPDVVRARRAAAAASGATAEAAGA